MTLTLHLLGLAHLPSIEASPVWACAYTQKMVKLARMMKQAGYPVIYYGVEGSQVDCSEFVTCLTEQERQKNYGPLERFASEHFKYGPEDQAYKLFIERANKEIAARVEGGDIIINPIGNFYAKIGNPLALPVEGGIGYTGVLPTTHKVFESHTWRSFIYGKYGIEDVRFFDTVIPNFFDPEHYLYSDQKEDYFLMVCRQTWRKGVQIAVDTAKAVGLKLILAGQPGEMKITGPGIEQIGYIDEKEKIDLLSHAKALFQPTLYNAPFEGVTVEAGMSGTPVITTDQGCFTETVRHDLTGYRCNVLKEFIRATKDIENITPAYCREWTISNYSLDVCARKYDEYFQRLGTLWREGWYET